MKFVPTEIVGVVIVEPDPMDRLPRYAG